MSDPSLDVSLLPESIIQHELTGSESLLWAGRPRAGIRFSPADIVAVPFSLMWGGFAFFWEYMVLRSRAPFPFALFGLPFILVGVYLIVGRFLADALRRRNTVYGVTSGRLIIVSGVWSRAVQSFSLATLPSLTLHERRDGSGTIAAGPAGMAFVPAGMAVRVSAAAPRLEFIENARDVYERIQRAQQSAARSGSGNW